MRFTMISHNIALDSENSLKMEGRDRVEHVPIGLHELFQEDAGLCNRCYVDGMRGRVFWVENIAVCFELFAVQRIGAVAHASNATVIREVRGHQRIKCRVNSALPSKPALSVSDIHCTSTLKPSKPMHAVSPPHSSPPCAEARV